MINPDYKQEKRDILCTVSIGTGFTSGKKYTVQMEDRYVMSAYNDAGILTTIDKEYFYQNFRIYPHDELIIK